MTKNVSMTNKATNSLTVVEIHINKNNTGSGVTQRLVQSQVLDLSPIRSRLKQTCPLKICNVHMLITQVRGIITMHLQQQQTQYMTLCRDKRLAVCTVSKFI